MTSAQTNTISAQDPILRAEINRRLLESGELERSLPVPVLLLANQLTDELD